jgi:hypothetical protein
LKQLYAHGARLLGSWLGRAFCWLGTAALAVIAWLGWIGAGAQASLEALWGLCGVR